MKTKFNLLLLTAISFVTIAAAQTPKSDLLVGSWKLQSLQAKFPENFTDAQKADGEKTIADDEKEFKKAPFRFTKNRKLSVGEMKLTWTMSDDGNTVNVMKGEKQITVATILTLSDQQLVFTRPDDGMIVTYTLTR